jgi:hypothetical protein
VHVQFLFVFALSFLIPGFVCIENAYTIDVLFTF